MCKRKKAFSLARLAAKYGPEQSLDGLLRDVAHTCPWYNEAARKYEPRCGAGFVDLERNLPPADHPEEPIYRQRQPAREDLPKPPKSLGMRPLPATPLPSNVVPMPVRPEPVRPPPMPVIVAAVPRLAHWPAPEIVFACAGCEIRQAHSTALLLRAMPQGGKTPLADVLAGMRVSCPLRAAGGPCSGVLAKPEGEEA